MTRSSATSSIDAIIRAAAEGVVGRISRVLADAVARTVEERLIAELKRAPPLAGRKLPRKARRSRPAAKDITKWVADRRARRVPKFVIKATELDTKMKIVARFGEDAQFELGKALPAVKAAETAAKAPVLRAAPRVVRARPPIVRKTGGTK
jgi:hypothetical protein